MNVLEIVAWSVGMSLPNESAWRPWVFLVSFHVMMTGDALDNALTFGSGHALMYRFLNVRMMSNAQIGILLNLRLPRGFMPNDFHGEPTQKNSETY